MIYMILRQDPKGKTPWILLRTVFRERAEKFLTAYRAHNPTWRIKLVEVREVRR